MFVLQASDSPGILQTFLEGLYSNYKQRIAVLKRQIVRSIKTSRLNIGLCLCGSLDYSASKLSSSQKKDTCSKRKAVIASVILSAEKKMNSFIFRFSCYSFKVGYSELKATNYHHNGSWFHIATFLSSSIQGCHLSIIHLKSLCVFICDGQQSYVTKSALLLYIPSFLLMEC